MIDFHNHILPNVDDGSKSVEMSLEMLREAEKQGVSDVVNTVHYQHPKMYGIDTSYNFIKTEIDKLQSIVDHNNIKIKIHAGAEVFFDYNLTEILSNPITTIGGGKYMLIEFQTLSLPKDYEKTIFDLQLQGVTPIIAHPERYRPIQNNLKKMSEWLGRGYIIQLDAGSLLGHFGQHAKECAMKIINMGACHIIGSDAHNNKKRNFVLKDAFRIAESILGPDNLNNIILNAERVVSGVACESSITNMKNINRDSMLQRIKNRIIRK